MAKPQLIELGLSYPDLHASIHIAIANLGVSLTDISASYLGKPNVSKKRQRVLNSLLNDIVKHKKSGGGVDLVVFPEVCIPHSWASMLVTWARRHQVGVICGLEHRVDAELHARNELLAALPYRVSGGHWTCAVVRRLKRLYSPHEAFTLKEMGFKIPPPIDPYHLIRWRGASFGIYNCYELASIEDRCIFKSRVDFIVASEFNRDTSYFSNIVEAAARDLHAYVIQANDSKYGDSRVVSPSKSDRMNPLRIKGGENVTFLVMNLDLKGLRDHQRKGYGLQKDSEIFKSTPPGFNQKLLLERIKLGDGA